MTRPTLTDAERWTPDALREAADAWDAAAADVHAGVEIAVQGVDASREFWTGSAAEAARRHALDVGRASDAVARATVMAAVAARDGADQIAAAQAKVLSPRRRRPRGRLCGHRRRHCRRTACLAAARRVVRR